eukprot:UN24520
MKKSKVVKITKIRSFLYMYFETPNSFHSPVSRKSMMIGRF